MSQLSGLRKFLATESPLKMMKNAFYFTLKALFVLKILTSQDMTSQVGKQTIPIHILSNISRSKGNQKMKFGQSTEYNTRNIFVEKSYRKCVKETIPKPLSKNQNLAYLCINSVKF